MLPIKILKTWLGLPCWDSFAGVTFLGWLCWGGFDGAALLWQIYCDLDFIFSCSNKIILREKWRQQQNILPAWKWLDYGDPSYFASVRKVWKSCAKQKILYNFKMEWRMKFLIDSFLMYCNLISILPWCKCENFDKINNHKNLIIVDLGIQCTHQKQIVWYWVINKNPAQPNQIKITQTKSKQTKSNQAKPIQSKPN